MLEAVEIVLATANRHKAEEFRRLFPADGIVIPADLGMDFDHRETGATYLDNALGKAMALFRRVARPVMADDSGLSVAALAGEPGVYSARFGSGPAGPKLDDADRNRHLLERMRSISDRRAFFVCCLVLVVEEHRLFVAQETVGGLIAHQPAGSGGFGYDPLFFLPDQGMTVAQIPDAEKDRVSHRGRAAARMVALLATLSR